jgi:subtilisin family serine protease
MLILNNSVFSQVIITEQSEYMQSNDKIVFSDQNIIVKVNNSQEMRILSENIFYGIEVEEVKQLKISSISENINIVGINISEEKEANLLKVTLKNKGKQQILDAIKKLNKTKGIEYAEPDYVVSISTTHNRIEPNDTYYNYLYGMLKINAPQAWETTVGSSSVMVGIIDTGIDINHCDLKENIWVNPNEIPNNGIDDDNNGYIDDVHGWNFVSNNNNVMDDNGHGTHVSGTIGAIGNNNEGVVGVAWDVNLVALKALDAQGYGYTTNIIEAVNYANNMGIPITNNSYGGGSFSNAFKDTISAGGLYIAAAGNDGLNNDITPHYPSSYDCENIISVASTNETDGLSYFSNYGRNSVHIGAPGSNIYSCLPGNKYGSYSGTSMATPHVVGTAALIKAFYPDASTAQIKEALLFNNERLEQFNNTILSGGRLNAEKALMPVVYVPINEIKLNRTEATIKPRTKLTLTAEILPIETSNRRIIWTSDDTSVAKVNSYGGVQAVSNGTTTIKAISAENNDVYASCTIIVEGNAAVVSITDTNFKLHVIEELKHIPVAPWEDPNIYNDYDINSILYPEDVEKITHLSLRRREIKNLNGIEYFTNLESLDCSDNEITALDVSMLYKLRRLICSFNQINELDFSIDNNWSSLIINHNYLDISEDTPLWQKLETLKQRINSCIYLPQLTYIDVTDISIDTNDFEISKRDTRLLRAIIAPIDASDQSVTWSSSAPDIVSITESGVVTGKSQGIATITVTSQANPEISSTCTITVLETQAEAIVFNDYIFKEEVIKHLKKIDDKYNGYDTTSLLYPDDVILLTELRIWYLEITDMTGISKFFGLESIYFSNLDITSLDLSQLINLRSVQINETQLQTLNASGLKKIHSLRLSSNRIRSLDLNNTTSLINLLIANNELTTLDLSMMIKLETLFCYNNRLEYINTKDLNSLDYFVCRENKLTELDLSNSFFLRTFDCKNNNLTSLLIQPENNWYSFECQNNYLDVFEGSQLKKNLDIIEQRIISTLKYLPQNPPPPIPIVALSPSVLHLESQPTGSLTAQVFLDDAQNKNLTWSSNNEDVAIVDANGNVTATGHGKAVVRAALTESTEIYGEAVVIVSSFDDYGQGTEDNPYKITD